MVSTVYASIVLILLLMTLLLQKCCKSASTRVWALFLLMLWSVFLAYLTEFQQRNIEYTGGQSKWEKQPHVHRKRKWTDFSGSTQLSKIRMTLPTSTSKDAYTAYFSITSNDIAKRVAQCSLELLILAYGTLERLQSKERTLCDAMACIGGNTYGFGKVFHDRRVPIALYAIEKNKSLFEHLTHNMEIVLPKSSTVRLELRQDDTLDILSNDVTLQHTCSVLFFDPEWGGVDYKKQPEKRLLINGLELDQAIGDVVSSGWPELQQLIIKTPKYYEHGIVDAFLTKLKSIEHAWLCVRLTFFNQRYYMFCRDVQPKKTRRTVQMLSVQSRVSKRSRFSSFNTVVLTA